MIEALRLGRTARLRARATAGIVVALTAPVDAISATEIRAGGALEVTVSGFAGMLAHGGDLAQQREDPELADGLDFSTDTELHVLARARDAELGLDYGATIELEADTDETFNADETWIFLRSGCG